jgi:flagellar basal body-associated protein FliL
MMSNKKKLWIGIILAVVVIAVISLYLLSDIFESNPCDTETVEVLIGRYPQLKDLKTRQEHQMEKLLEIQRQQDVIVNLQMSSDKLSADTALRLSLDQVAQVAAVRKRQHEQFDKMCRDIVSAGK